MATVTKKALLKVGLSEENIRKYAGGKPLWWHANITDSAISSIEEVSARKIVTIYCEYSTDCLLDYRGHEILAHYLPISPGLIERIDAWRRRLDEVAEIHRLGDEPADWNGFVKEGYEIGLALKQELPDWTVSYADQWHIYLTPDGYFCPEILADGSLGPCVIEGWKGVKPSDRVNTFIQ